MVLSVVAMTDSTNMNRTNTIAIDRGSEPLIICSFWWSGVNTDITGLNRKNCDGMLLSVKNN